ncbi:MAG: PAS domain-containing protein [Synechococcaceae cyanobacterium SM2_3_1]|nr:PAS domain-containing protein [Synechococcaceae cyanobacterium SM2_3_1]
MNEVYVTRQGDNNPPSSGSTLPDPEALHVINTQLQEEIRERHRVEKELLRSQQQLEIFIENAPCAIAMFNRELCYLAHSKRWSQDYGLGGQELLGRSHYEIFPEIPERWKKSMGAAWKGR